MKAEQLSDNVYNQLVNLPYARKANLTNEVGTLNVNTLNEELQEAISSFPILEIEKEIDLLAIDTLDGDQQFYILQEPDQTQYLVDTQGYNYPRYIVRLPRHLNLTNL